MHKDCVLNTVFVFKMVKHEIILERSSSKLVTVRFLILEEVNFKYSD